MFMPREGSFPILIEEGLGVFSDENVDAIGEEVGCLQNICFIFFGREKIHLKMRLSFFENTFQHF